MRSRGEIKVEEILSAAGVNFESEYSFPDLLSFNKNPLRFDFCVFDDDGEINFLIEIQGIQHYQPKEKFGGIEGLRKQQYNDMLKRDYCREHNIPLVIIPYTEIGIVNYDYLMRAGNGW